MLFHGNLLKRYVNLKDDAKNIANYLTLKTAEVEEVIERKIPDEVVIGYVTKCEKHPNADKLKVTEVDCWEKWKYQIVTGADNIRADIYVPVALPGAYLPAKDLKIKPVNMRWVESNGMICSKEELWIAEDLDKHGIWILQVWGQKRDKRSEENFGGWGQKSSDRLEEESNLDDFGIDFWKFLWKSLWEVLPFLNNFIFDIDNKTLTNRPDLTGHLWQAIELNTIYKLQHPEKIYMSNINQIFSLFFDSNIFDILEHSDKLEGKKLFVETNKARSYVMLLLKNIKVKKTDFKTRLDLIDLQEESINNWVDFSNLFMFLTSQPIHFFDADKIKWNVVVKEASGGEKFKALDGKEYELSKWDIIIVDDEKILALAGIIWGESSAIDDKTENILVEIANFDPIQVRKTWNRLALRTNAKIRFEKNISPLFSLYALLLFLDQLKLSGLEYELGGLNYHFSDEARQLFSKKVKVDFEDLRSFSGLNISDDEIKSILENLWFRLYSTGEQSNFFVLVPAWRSPADINIPEDIYEEVIRIYGYENIEGKDLVRKIDYVPLTEKIDLVQLSERIFVEDFHFTLLETYPWFNEKFLTKTFNTDLLEKISDKLLSLLNPTAPENKYLRSNLFFNLLQVVEKNFRNFDKIKTIETGKTFSYVDGRKNEKLKLWAVIYKKSIPTWKENNILELRNVLEKLLKEYSLKWLLEIQPIDDKVCQKISPEERFNCELINLIAHPKQKWIILLNKQPIGFMFSLHPYYHKNLKISDKSQISFLELDLDKLIQMKKKSKIKPIQKVNYFTLEDQIVERDLSFVIPKEKNYQDILLAVRKPKEIIDFEVFDIYDLWDKKSISIRIKIYGENMTSEDINSVMEKVIKEVEKVWGKLRE